MQDINLYKIIRKWQFKKMEMHLLNVKITEAQNLGALLYKFYVQHLVLERT